MQISKWVALGVAAFCLVAVGGVVNMPHLYYMAAMLITLPVVSYGIGWYTLQNLTFTRHAPTPVWEGEVTDVAYTASNPSKIARFFISIHEPALPYAETIKLDPPLFNLRAGETVTVKTCVRFQRRGVYKTGQFEVTALDPLGVFSFTRTIPSEDITVVYPSPREIGSLQIIGAANTGWNDSNLISRNGDGVDTNGVRGYLPGDPLRYIHWRQTARTGELAVVEFEETKSVNLRILLDTNAAGVVGLEPETTLEYAIRIAATIARDAISGGAGVELVTADPEDSKVVSAWNGLAGESGEGRLYSI